jgi:hypothetical protein
MFSKSSLLLALSLLLITLSGVAQSTERLTQTVRGQVIDLISQTPLPGATVLILNTDPMLGATSDLDGHFKIPNVPVGKQTIRVSYTGYKAVTMADLNVNSGKELVLNIALEEDIQSMEAVEIVAEQDKKEAVNSMASVSTRTFSVEETQKFAAAVNDPGRMAISFAGVVATDDGNNTISVRGNSPYGLLWRMEGVDIPNPNHFSNQATSGGGVSILSAQLLSNSDFMTGAFSPEYGNALAGVFDLRLRKGNTEKREYTFQAGFMGIDAAAEGPIRKGYNGSYLINYRYSTLSLLGKIGVPLGDAITNFQDLSFNVYLPTEKAGNFSLFGFGGLSSQKVDAQRDSTAWIEVWNSYDQRFFANTGAVGIKHFYLLNDNHYIQSVLLASGNGQGYTVDQLGDDYAKKRLYKEAFDNSKTTLSTTWNWKMNSAMSLRTGMYLNHLGFSLNQQSFNFDTDQMQTDLYNQNTMQTAQFFSQMKYRMNDRLTLLYGAHGLYVAQNKRFSAEPRISMKYALNANNMLHLGYGLHSQVQPTGLYYIQVNDASNNSTTPNKNLDFNKAHHFVAGLDHVINKHLHVKGEMYYQHLYNIAIEDSVGSSISTLNLQDQYLTTALVNRGFGRNYGAELTVEQFTHRNMYFLLSASLFESEYKAMDGVWRDTRFNIGHSVTFTGGKEWNVGASEKNRTLGVNIRLIYTGGQRRTPIDIDRSIAEGREIEVESLAYTLQMRDYFRTDLRIALKRNRAKSTSTLSLDLQNATNHNNAGGYYFDLKTQSIKEWKMVPLIPIISYKIEF